MLNVALGKFQPITLADLEQKALLDRVEVKYALHAGLLPHLLDQLQAQYQVLEVAGCRLNHYRTLYFDTPDFAMFRRHHMGAQERWKVRARQYVESDYAFLEVKHRTRHKRTVKERIATPALVTALGGNAADFVHDHCPYMPGSLVPRLWNAYSRITLVSKLHCERVTLDLDLGFTWQKRHAGLASVVIAEVKRPAHGHSSDFAALMRRYHVRKTGFSKYCLGVSLLYPQVKHNRFKALQRLAARISHGGTNDCFESIAWFSGEFAGGAGDRAWDLLPSPA